MKHWNYFKVGFNDHPGKIFVATWTVMAFLVCAKVSVLRGIIAASINLIVFGSIVVVTSYKEGKRQALK